jgi:hypothetical protein
MVLLSMIPQIHLWVVRGRDWNGAYVSPQGDEIFYSGYINALIDGRPRKNDPFGGRDDSSSAHLPESTFSIQFIPAYAIALLAKLFHVSASTAFILLTGVSTLLATLSVFWLLQVITIDHRRATAGTLFVLCLGWIVGRHGIFNTFFDIGIPALHFVRRYQPAAVFPLFFFFQTLVWCAFTSDTKRVRRNSTIAAALILAILVYSYFYLWTGGASWLVCFGLLWMWFRPNDRSKVLLILASILATALVTAVPYVYLVLQRSTTLDIQQTLTSTRQTDLSRPHEIIGAVVLIGIIIGIRRQKFARTEPRVIYIASLALLPFVVFNEQVFTGKTMQPFHYEIFVVNYTTMVAILVFCTLVWKQLHRRLLISIAVLSLCAGIIAVALPARLVFVPAATANDKGIPVLLRLRERSSQDGTLSALREKGYADTLVFSPSISLMTLLPTWTSQGTLLDVGALDFGSATFEQRKTFLYMHMYYSKVDPVLLRDTLTETGAKQPDELTSFRSMIFGHERTIPALSFQFSPVRPEEVEQEVRAYENYCNAFSREQALKRQITYAVIPADREFDFSNVDRWYSRDSGERVGSYVLYRLKIRS